MLHTLPLVAVGCCWTMTTLLSSIPLRSYVLALIGLWGFATPVLAPLASLALPSSCPSPLLALLCYKAPLSVPRGTKKEFSDSPIVQRSGWSAPFQIGPHPVQAPTHLLVPFPFRAARTMRIVSEAHAPVVRSGGGRRDRSDVLGTTMPHAKQVGLLSHVRNLGWVGVPLPLRPPIRRQSSPRNHKC